MSNTVRPDDSVFYLVVSTHKEYRIVFLITIWQLFTNLYKSHVSLGIKELNLLMYNFWMVQAGIILCDVNLNKRPLETSDI